MRKRKRKQKNKMKFINKRTKFHKKNRIDELVVNKKNEK